MNVRLKDPIPTLPEDGEGEARRVGKIACPDG